jgi:hypothetical protein
MEWNAIKHTTFENKFPQKGYKLPEKVFDRREYKIPALTDLLEDRLMSDFRRL